MCQPPLYLCFSISRGLIPCLTVWSTGNVKAKVVVRDISLLLFLLLEPLPFALGYYFYSGEGDIDMFVMCDDQFG